MKRTNKTANLTQIALIGALYAVLTLAVAPFSFGSMQLRIAEVFALLPLFGWTGAWGVTFGCFFANLIGFFIGANPLGLIDAFVGTAATLVAAVITCGIGRLPIGRLAKCLLAPIPVILFNGILIGLELAVLFTTPGESLYALWIINGLSVAAGEAIVLYTLGMLMLYALMRADLYKKLFKNAKF